MSVATPRYHTDYARCRCWHARFTSLPPNPAVPPGVAPAAEIGALTDAQWPGHTYRSNLILKFYSGHDVMAELVLLRKLAWLVAARAPHAARTLQRSAIYPLDSRFMLGLRA